MEEKQSKIDSITKELRKKETAFNDFKNKNEKLILKIKEIESEKKLLEVKLLEATENENHNSSKDHGKKLVYAATIIILVISIACVYVYSKTSLSVQHPYGEGTQTISAEEDNIIKADLSEVAETDESEASKTCATETEGPSEACASGCSANPHQNKLHYDLKELFLKKEDYDVTIKVEGSEFPVLRAILKARSPVFASTFRHNMKENATGILEIEDCDPSTFSDFLCFLYCGDVGIISQKNVFGLFTAADKYQVLDLRAKCLEFIKKNLTVDTFCETIPLALQHSETELIKLSTDYFIKNAPKIIVTVKWQTFLAENPTESNELLVKLLVPGSSSSK